MLEYDKFDISEGIDVNKTNLSKECELCHYWFLKDIGFKYEPYLCNGCHDLMQKDMSFNNAAVASVKGNAQRIHFWYMTNDDAINIMNGSNLVEKRVFYKIFFIYMKMSESTYLTYYQRKRDVIVNRANNYYKNNKNRLKEQARGKYRNLSEQEKNRIWEKQILQYVSRKETKTKRMSKKLSQGKKVLIK